MNELHAMNTDIIDAMRDAKKLADTLGKGKDDEAFVARSVAGQYAHWLPQLLTLNQRIAGDLEGEG